MMTTLERWLDDPEDAARYASLAILLGRLREEHARARFAAAYRTAAPDPLAAQSLDGLLSAAAVLRAREESHPAEAVEREVAQVA